MPSGERTLDCPLLFPFFFRVWESGDRVVSPPIFLFLVGKGKEPKLIGREPLPPFPFFPPGPGISPNRFPFFVSSILGTVCLVTPTRSPISTGSFRPRRKS